MDTNQDLVNSLVGQVSKQIIEQSSKQVLQEVNKQLSEINIQQTVENIVTAKLEQLIKLQNFPKSSIHHTSIDFTGISLTGDIIKGGIINGFGSTGIEDLANNIQVTVMDHATAFEGPLWAPSAEIKGNLTVDGKLTLKGTIDTESPGFIEFVEHSGKELRKLLNKDLFKAYSAEIYETIAEQGLDLDRITQGGKEVVRANQLGYHITDTNIQKLGMITDLQTKGEAYISETLYVSNDRVGVNTMDPSGAFVVWDEEVEMLVTKRKDQTGFIGTTRPQKVVLGSNNKENILLETDGSVRIETLKLGDVTMTTDYEIPNYEGDKGTVVWNESPELGSAIGWVCLGGTRWAKFGKVE